MLILLYILIEIIMIIIGLKYLSWYVAVFFALIFTIFISTKHKSKMYVIFGVIIFLVTCLSYNYNSYCELRQYENSSEIVECEILSLNSINKDRGNIKLLVKLITIAGKHVNEKAFVYMDKKYLKNEKPGDIISFQGKINKLDEYNNFHISTYENHLRNKGIKGQLFCEDHVTLIRHQPISLYRKRYEIKNRVEKVFYFNMSKSSADIILSILLGDKNYLDASLKKSVLATGIAHVFAVSGLHVGIIIKILYAFLDKILYQRKYKIIVTLVLVWFYGFIVLFPISICRALIMFTFLYISKLTYRKYAAMVSLAISAIIIILLNPFSIFSAGFLLSYSVTYAIISCKVCRSNNIRDKLKNSMKIYIRILIISFPLVAYFFNYFSYIGIIMNLIFIPFFVVIIQISFILMMLSFLSFSSVIVPMRILNYAISFIKYVILKVGNINIFGVSLCGHYIMSFSIEQILCFYVVLLLIRYYANKRKTTYGNYCMYSLLMIISLNIVCLASIFNYSIYSVFDIGQGIFTNLSINGSNYFFDAGSTDGKIYDYTIKPIIMKNGYFNINNIYISHFHSDHYSAVSNIIDDFEVNKISISHNFPKNIIESRNDEKGNSSNLNTLRNKIEYESIDCEILSRGYTSRLADKIFIGVLSPYKGCISSNENNNSNVYWLYVNGVNFLLTGDIEAEIEISLIHDIERLKNKYGAVDVLMVGHHGSKTSSIHEFVDVVSPKIAVMSYGENSYGIPSKDVIERYEEKESIILKTKEDGQINFFVIAGELYYNTCSGKHSKNWRNIILISVTVNLLVLFYIYKFRRIYEL